MKRRLLSIICILACNTGFALSNPQSQQVIVVDCGSSGTRIHLFEKNGSTVSEPLKKNKIIPGLSSFIDDAASATQPHGVDVSGINQSMDQLIDSWKHDGINIDANAHLFVYATAGLRLVRQDAANLAIQTAANELKKDLKLNSTPTNKVITGNEEALYDWIGVNLAEPTNGTYGVLDLGGASTEIAFNLPTHPSTPTSFYLQTFDKNYLGNPYHIATQSLLGEGQDAAMASINGNFPNNHAVCYPNGIWSDEALGEPSTSADVNYNFQSCQHNVNQFFINKKISKQLSAIHQLLPQKKSPGWLAISGFQYTAQFFNANNVNELENNASQDNGIQWTAVLTKYPDSPQFLQKYFFSASYSTALLKTMLNTDAPNVTFTKGADWTNGVAFDYFFKLENKHS